MTVSTRSSSHHRPAVPSFENRGRTSLPALDGALACYVHLPTGARHLHLDLPAEDCAFLMAFLTPAPDSSGLTHVLEHLVMCGSERYPCRRAFFAMLGRTLSTTMNALTTEDCTAYHFATRSLADYENLLSVYLDAAFFPRLDRLDFDQEGCRVEIETAGEEGETPVRRGVVLNEMRGLMNDPEQQLQQALNCRLFPSTPYRFNAGGDPWRIPGLDYETLRAYHRRHYHPGNAVFLSAGTLRPEWLHVRLEELALAQFPRRGPSPAPPPAWGEPVSRPPAGWPGTPAIPPRRDRGATAKRPRLTSLEVSPLEAPSRSVVRYPTVGTAGRKPASAVDAADREPADTTDTADQGSADTVDRGPAGTADAADREPASAADAVDRRPAGTSGAADRGSAGVTDAAGQRPADAKEAADRELADTADAAARELADVADQGRTDASVALAWRLGDTSDPVAVGRARLLACCLLEQGDAPLRRALEAPGSPAAALASNGVQVTRRRIVFQCGVHGCDPDLAGEIESRVLAAIDATARDGLDESRVEDALARIERELCELHDPRYPFPLKLLTRILPAALYGGEPAAALDTPRALAALRAEVRSRKDTAELVRRYLRDNPERVTVTAVPDPAAARRLDAEDRALLDREYGGPAGRQARNRAVERTRALRRRQRSRAGESSLPKIGLDAIGPPREPPELFGLPAGGSPAHAAPETTVEMEAGPPSEAAGDPAARVGRGSASEAAVGPLDEAADDPPAGVGRSPATETADRSLGGAMSSPTGQIDRSPVMAAATAPLNQAAGDPPAGAGRNPATEIAGRSPGGAMSGPTGQIDRGPITEVATGPLAGAASGPAVWISHGPTGGLVYARLAIDVPDLRPEQLDDVGLLCETLPESSHGGFAPAETRVRLARVCDRLEVAPWLLARAAPGSGVAGSGASGSNTSGSGAAGSVASGSGVSGSGAPGSNASGIVPPRMMVVFSARALAGDENALLEILAGAHLEARFDKRAREIAARARVRRSRELVRNGHLHAERVAAARLDLSAAVAERWQGPSALAILARAATGDDEGTSGGESGPGVTAQSLEERLHHVHRTLAAAPHQLQIVRDHGDRTEGCPDLPRSGRRTPEFRAAVVPPGPAHTHPLPSLVAPEPRTAPSAALEQAPPPSLRASGPRVPATQDRQEHGHPHTPESRASAARAVMRRTPAASAWIVDGPVNYCAKVYPAVTADHPDAGPLAVLAAFLGGDLLQRAVRERGGAYGAGARYCARTCTVRMFSYRDPRLAETLRDFGRAVETLYRHPPDGRRLEEAILRAVRDLDKPKAFQIAAFERYLDELQGRGAAGTRALRASVLGASPGQLREVAERYLRPEQGYAGVLAGAGCEGELDRLGLPWRRL